MIALVAVAVPPPNVAVALIVTVCVDVTVPAVSAPVVSDIEAYSEPIVIDQVMFFVYVTVCPDWKVILPM